MEEQDSTVLAHISEDGTRTQRLSEHLSGTAALAGTFAAAFGASAEGDFAGSHHDDGKNTEAFQHRLHGGPPTDHSTAGARYAFECQNLPAAFSIAGHHGGLPDGGNPSDPRDAATLCGRCKRPMPEFLRPVPAPVSTAALLPAWAGRDALTSAFFTRMLYSCLVDADFLDTETFMNDGPAPRSSGDPIPVLLEKVRRKAAGYRNAPSTTEVFRQRNQVLRACQESGRTGPQGLYTLTVPTGGGKTFASLAFALEHAAHQKMDRVIYVIPYTSIIDQTAATFSELLGAENVLAHFSTVDYKITEREDLTPLQRRQILASENWDAPVVITTSVQFFESLYANRSSRCRKLHNIANSVVIFDEAQTLPDGFLAPCVSAIAQLVQHYHTTAVLCTATQPDLSALFHRFAPELSLREISPDPARLYQVLRRVTLRDLGTLSAQELCGRLAEFSQVLCVVNRRKTAQELFEQLPSEGSYCLTTLLCAADRRRQLDEIRQRLRDGLPCRVVSTSLIEAGVDVDFPFAFRELAGLDSLLQTAGRCNREGRRHPEESIVSYFRIEGLAPLSGIAQKASSMESTARNLPDLDSPEAIRRYFQERYRLRGSFDDQAILDALEHGIQGCMFPFAQVAQKFRMINTPAHTIYIPIDEGAALCEALRSGYPSRPLLRRLGAYSVECYDPQFQELRAAGVLDLREDGSAILHNLNQYDRNVGLLTHAAAPELLIF